MSFKQLSVYKKGKMTVSKNLMLPDSVFLKRKSLFSRIKQTLLKELCHEIEPNSEITKCPLN